MTAIVAADVAWKYSAPAASAGNTTAQANPNASLGKYVSTTAWAGGVANDLFDDITGAENAASTVDYRCVFIDNTNASNTYQNAVAYISSEVAGGASLAIGVDPAAASARGSSTQQAAAPANETTAPSGVSFSSPTTAAGGVSLGSIPSGSVRGLWVRRSAANTSALSSDGGTLAVSGDTGSL